MLRFRALVFIAVVIALPNGYILNQETRKLSRNQRDVGESADESLVLSHVLFRHGNRTPEQSELYPKDPYINETFYPYLFGQLTNTGKLKEYSIGTALRERYDTFLGDYYLPDLVIARSTDYNRTKMSLMLVLASLFPPKGEELWQPGLDWQPIPYNYVPLQYDEVLYGIDCPNYIKLYELVQLLPEVQAEYAEYQDTFTYIAENTGLTINKIQDVYTLYFGLSTEEEFPLLLPNWTQSVWPETIYNIAVKQYDIYTKTSDLRKMCTGYFIQKLIVDTERVINTESNKTKLYLYSAHESNIGQLFTVLELFEYPHIPTYGAYVLFEVHNIDGIYGLKIYYQNYDNETSTTPKLLTLPSCEEFCPWDQFKLLVEELLPEQGLCGTTILDLI